MRACQPHTLPSPGLILGDKCPGGHSSPGSCPLPRPTQAGCWSSEVTARFAHPERGDTKHENPPTFPGTGLVRDGLSSLTGMPASGAKTAYLHQVCVNVKSCRGQTCSGSLSCLSIYLPPLRSSGSPGDRMQISATGAAPKSDAGVASELWWE